MERKTVIRIIGLWFVSTFLASCHYSLFLQRDYINVSSVADFAGKLETEISNTNNQYELWRYLETDTLLSLDVQQVTACYQGKTLKCRLINYGDEYWDYNSPNHIDLVGKSLYIISLKGKLKGGDSLVVVERNFPKTGDSIVTSVFIPPTLINNFRSYMGDESEMGRFYHKKVTAYFRSKGDTLAGRNNY